MHIGLVIYGSLDAISGGYLYDRRLVEYLRSQGDVVEIISLPWRNYTAHLMDNLHFRLPGKLDVLIEDELNHPSLIFANRGKHPYPVVSLVHHLRSSELRPVWQNSFYRFVEKMYLQSVDGIIYNSKTTKKVVIDLLDNSKPSVLVYPPVDQFGPPISQHEILERAHREEFGILFLGNVIYRKGLHTLLEAARNLNAKVHVDVIGSLTTEPAYVNLIQEIIEKNQLSACVSLHGSLAPEYLIDKLRQSHVLVVPSSYEGFGIVYLEGMCFGLPAIGTTAGAAGEVIEPGKTGYLIAPEDVPALSGHLQSLAKDRSLLTLLSLNARERYLRQPSWTGSAKNIRELSLLSLIENRPSMDYAFPRYLLAKQTVDDRALNKDVVNALRIHLPPEPFSIIDLGAGIGTMLRRLVEWNLFCTGEYVLVDAMQENISYAREWIPLWAAEAGLSVERIGQDYLQLSDRSRDIQIRFECADVFDFAERNKAPADLLIAHAFLDLLPMPESLKSLFTLTKRLAWLTINFDGMSSLQPAIDPALDEKIEGLYHESMDARITGGDSHTGRKLFEHLRYAEAEILAAGASDWVVHPGEGEYPADEKYFLHFILHFFEESLKNSEQLEANTFKQWLEKRHEQIECGELVYIAHQMDFLVRKKS